MTARLLCLLALASACDPAPSPEIPCDGVDQDGDGADLTDVDGDGVDAWGCGGLDCDDADPNVHPGATETWYDGIDQDCDWCSDFDQDADGFEQGADCDDQDPTVHPDAAETWYDGVDQDCDGASDFDRDGDGVPRDEDCDDQDPSVHPGAVEILDGLDQDCDGGPDVFVPSNADVSFVGSEPGGNTGVAVALPGDLDGDGKGDLVVGAPETTPNGAETGTAFVLRAPRPVGRGGGVGDEGAQGAAGTLRPDDAWVRIVGEDPRSSDRTSGELAGYAVAGAGDLDADGVLDLAVGAAGWDTWAGGVGVFLGGGALAGASGEIGITRGDAFLMGSDEAAGFFVAGLGDVNGDGRDDLGVGGPYTGTGAGVAWIVTGPVTGSVALADVACAAISGAEGGLMGYHLASAGDVDGDGLWDVLVGAPGGYSDDDPDPGRACLLTDPSGTISAEDATATFEGEADEDLAGRGLGGGDLDGDGTSDVIVGAPCHGGEAGDCVGSVYVFPGPVTGARALADAPVRIEGAVEYTRLGGALGSTDVDGDGVLDLVLGAYTDPTGNYMAGAVYIARGPFSGVLSSEDLPAKFLGDASDTSLGYALAVDATALWVGAPGYAVTGDTVGAAFWFGVGGD